jgi:thiamine-monophosphate kinase
MKTSMPLYKLGEFGLLDSIRKKIKSKATKNSNIVVDIGDDAFVGRLSNKHLMVVTKDMLVENIHFKREWCTPRQLGWKSMAVNLSDLASMGKCRPLYAFIGLALPPDTSVDYVDKLYTGMMDIGDKYGLTIAGGDTVSNEKNIVISITLVGEIEQKYVLTRGCAQVGDILLVSGTLGDSAGGLHLLQKGMDTTESYTRYLIKKHLLPQPRFDISVPLATSGKLTGMIDASDGLAASVTFITQASRVGARIDMEKLPISKALRTLSRKDTTVNPEFMAITGGEDYELVFTVPRRHLGEIQRRCPGIVAVGEITKDSSVRYYLHGVEQSLHTAGFQHFSAEKS